MSDYPKVNYIGNKEKLTDWIISEMPVKSGKVLDIFSGGCSVSYALKKKGYCVISNDILYANFVLAKALIENQNKTLPVSVFDKKTDAGNVRELTEKFDFLSNRLYYDYEVEELARLTAISEKLKGNERYMFLALMRRAMIRKIPYSRMNVPWDQIQRLRDEDYSYKKYKRKRAYHNQSFESHMRENFEAYNNAVFEGNSCRAYNRDAVSMAKKTDKVDVVYMDPPYPATMNNYDSFYGLFDKMFDKEKQHIDFTQKTSFLDNVEKLVSILLNKTDYIVISQNTKGEPTAEELSEMLSKYGTVEIKEKKHNYQVTGKENKNISKELLLILRMKG